jgi:hypothetical protein
MIEYMRRWPESKEGKLYIFIIRTRLWLNKANARLYIQSLFDIEGL